MNDMTIQRPALGQWVTAKDRIIRVEDKEKQREYFDLGKVGRRYRKWVRYGDRGQPWESRPVSGIYSGYRTISDGYLTAWSQESPAGHIGTRYFECWLITPSERENPIRVFPDDVEIEEPT